MAGNYMDNFLGWLESTTPEERLVHPRPESRPWPYDGPEGRARLTGSLDTGGSFTGNDDDRRTYMDNPKACGAPEGWRWGYLPCGCRNDGYGRHAAYRRQA